MKINLSKIPNRENMDINEIIDWCLDNKTFTIVNDFGYGLEFELDDLKYVWEDIKNL